MSPSNEKTLRPVMGDFASIRCTKAIVVGVEKALGERAAHVALINAGRMRGREIAEQSFEGKNVPLNEAAPLLNQAIGAEGTRLCVVESVTESGDAIHVALSDTLCSAGEPQGSPRQLTFTMGAIQGAFEVLTGRPLKAKQIESVLRGGRFDVVELVNRI